MVQLSCLLQIGNGVCNAIESGKATLLFAVAPVPTSFPKPGTPKPVTVSCKYITAI
jgi:hypothetical protein